MFVGIPDQKKHNKIVKKNHFTIGKPYFLALR